MQLETTLMYDQRRNEVLNDRAHWLERESNELTEDWFLALEADLTSHPGAQAQILDGLLRVERNELAGRVVVGLAGSLSPAETTCLFLGKIRSELLGKLTQIKEFMCTESALVDQALVFFSGAGPWQPEWGVLWDALHASEEHTEPVNSMHEDASALIGIPFELIVGQDNPVTYRSFPWRPQDI